MAARAFVNRLEIANSYSTRAPATVIDLYRPPVEAVDDLEWYENDRPVEMGEGSTFGNILYRASLEHEWCPPDLRDMEEKKRGISDGSGHYGKSYGAGPWREWVDDARAPANADGEHGYFRDIWGERAHQTFSATPGDCGVREQVAAQMGRNIESVLFLMTPRLREVARTQHAPRTHGQTMRHVFGTHVRIVSLSETARHAFEVANHPDGEPTVYSWLEGIALRVKENKPRAGEKAIAEGARKEMSKELRRAYAAFEDARYQLRVEDALCRMPPSLAELARRGIEIAESDAPTEMPKEMQIAYAAFQEARRRMPRRRYPHQSASSQERHAGGSGGT